MKPFSRIDDDQRVIAANDRRRELQREEAELNEQLRGLREERDNPPAFAAKAEAYAAGVALQEPHTDIEARILNTKAKLDLVEAALGVQGRTIAEIRQSVGLELVEGLLPDYTPLLERVGQSVRDLCEALRAHHEFCDGMTAAGLPLSGKCPLGGFQRGAGFVLHDFGTSIESEHGFGAEFYKIARQYGYFTDKPQEKKRVTADRS